MFFYVVAIETIYWSNIIISNIIIFSLLSSETLRNLSCCIVVGRTKFSPMTKHNRFEGEHKACMITLTIVQSALKHILLQSPGFHA